VSHITEPSSPPLLVGRERELGVLRQHLDAALAGRGSLVLIGGEAGIGKTALAEALCREAAARDARVLTGRCYDLMETPPYGPWIELFRHYLPDGDLPPTPPAFAQRGTVGAVASQLALFQQVLEFFTALAQRQPLVVLLDDVHWADPASLDLLRFVARNRSSLPLLLIVAYRTDEVTRDDPLYALLPTLVREANPQRLNLRALGDDAMQMLVRASYGLSATDETRLVSYLHERTDGNPFFLQELLRTLEEEAILEPTERGAWELHDPGSVRVPVLVHQVIEGRLARLDSETQRLLAIAAVIGQEVPLGAWAAAAECEDDALLDAVAGGLEAHLIAEDSTGDRVRFTHALIRETLYERVPAMRRRRVHQRVGEVLAATRAPDPDAVAFHFQQAKDDRALPWLLKAGERAQAAYAWKTAASRFEAALVLMERTGVDTGERGRLMIHLSLLLRFADVPKARVFAEQASMLARSTNNRVLAAYAEFQRGFLGCMAGDVAGGLPEMEAGADALAALSETERARFAAASHGLVELIRLANERAMVVRFRAMLGRLRAAQELGEQLIAEAERGDEDVQRGISAALLGLGDAYAMLGMPDKATAMYVRARNAYLRASQHILVSYALTRELKLVALPYRTEDIAGRRQLAGMADAQWALASDTIPTTNAADSRPPLLVLEGEWDEAEQIALAGIAVREGMASSRTAMLTYLAPLAQLRGDHERARWAIRERLPVDAATEPGTVSFFDSATAMQRVAVLLSLDDHDLPTAKAWLEAHDRWLAWSDAVLGQSEGQALWAQYHRVAGERERAYFCATGALELATEPRQPLALLAAHRLLGELDTEAARFTDAEAHLAAALALADACAAPYERALTLLAQAELRVAEHRRDEAIALLNDARAVLIPLGANPALARADTLAAKLDATHTSAPTYPADLSAREVEVLHLIAQGHTNREIAAALFLSPGTVNVHVTHILTKTNTSNRTEAALFARDHGLA
jgi:DNA-binding CsgD family transcriptional regulator